MTFQKFKLTIFKLARRDNIVHLTPNTNVLQCLWEKEYSPDDVIRQMHATQKPNEVRSEATHA